MGAQLGKSKSLSISEKVNGQGKEVINHINGTTTLEKKNKKKKGKFSSQKSLDIKIDKFTSTDGNAASSSSTYITQLVNGSASNPLSYDARMSSSYHSGTPSKDVLDLRDACIRRGIISPEMNIITSPIPTEPEQQENVVEESTNESTEVVTNNEEVQNE